MPNIGILGLWLYCEEATGADDYESFTENDLKIILTLRPFKRAIICPILTLGTQIVLVKLYFFGKARFPDFQAMRSKISDRTIDHCRLIDLCSKFQLFRRFSG
jgi:hypothetical protein